MSDPMLALQIVEKGLEMYPEQFDLMADKARVLASTGRADEAIRLMEDWRRRKPLEFARGWRPVVFFCDAVRSSELTAERILALEMAFEDVTRRLPHSGKTWNSYAMFEMKIGNSVKAEQIINEALKRIPYNQELNYAAGQMLLEQGRAREALFHLEQALRSDMAEQYQHGVSQIAVLATAAQAYEAAGDNERAKLLYRQILESDEEDFNVKMYADNRMRAMAMLEGEGYSPKSTPTSQLRTMLSLLATNAGSSGKAREGQEGNLASDEDQ